MMRIGIVNFNLKAAVEREKAVQAIDVAREFTNCVVTFWVMSQFLNFLGASRGCADFRAQLLFLGSTKFWFTSAWSWQRNPKQNNG